MTCPYDWGDPLPPSPLREALSIALLILVFCGSLYLAGTVGADVVEGWRR